MRKLILAALLAFPAVAMAADGKALYEKHCQSCHGADGKGNPAKAKVLKLDPAKLNLGRDETKGMTRDEARTITVKGKEKMPAYEKKLQAADIDPVLDYTLGLAKALRGGG